MPEGIIIIPHGTFIDSVSAAGSADFFPTFFNMGMVVLVLCDFKERDAFVLGDAIVRYVSEEDRVVSQTEELTDVFICSFFLIHLKIVVTDGNHLPG